MLRKRKQPTPNFRLPPPYQPITGENAPLAFEGVFPYVAMMQIAKADTEQDYVICRGFDVRISRFIDYAEGDADKPGIPVAKPYGKRIVGTYQIGQIFPAILPLQTDNASPVDVLWRVGQNPGVSKTTQGHPADLAEEVEALKDTNDVYINWQLIDEGEPGFIDGCLAEDHPGYGVVFEINLMKWIPTNNGWGPRSPNETAKAIDWRTGAPYPDAGARGLFAKRQGYCDGEYTTIYEVVSLDCSVPEIDCSENEIAACTST